MKDSEIIKVLEDEIHLSEYVDSDYSDVEVKVLKSALDLINRQNVEIERLKKETEEYPFKCKVGNNSEVHSKSIEDYDNLIGDISVEAIKEFAEKLCNGRASNDPVVIAVKLELKEMTEVTEWKRQE